MSSTNLCAVRGNSDFYGFGIRLGTYFQFIATLLVTLFAPEEIPFYTALNNLWQTAMLAGLFLLTRSGSLQPPEPVICILLMFGSLSSLTGDGFNPLGTLSGLYRLLIYSGVAGYSVWFWFIGLDISTQENPLPCEVVVFFGDVSPYGKFRTFNKVVSILGLIICATLLFWSVWHFLASRAVPQLHQVQREGERRTDVVLLLISISIIVVSIIGCEYIIRANHMIITSTYSNPGIYDINAVGQIVPLLVGALGMIDTGKDVISGISKSQGRTWYAFSWKVEDLVAGFKKQRMVPTVQAAASGEESGGHQSDEIKTATASATPLGSGAYADDIKTPIVETNATD
jgi:hypothetical protein